eukprot:TRINITY_DN10183_c0_g1_i1.p1 TRINITY_DN10183_c0_g1~~TRINITY_DN10183_c0_g1_i1.p1  ORF type:complete len:642 (+),score=201.87 TRINITY_DN10183_c0_g1_i1:88-2013(+)
MSAFNSSEAEADVRYNRCVPICIKSHSDSSTTQSLRVQLQLRILSSSERQVLHIRLTDDHDPFFLLTLDLDESDYTALKHQQGLKVDFLSFPRDLAALFDRCVQSNGSYMCQLERTASNAPATLSILESNAFKNLAHLSLSLVAADDATVRQYLASCLRKLQDKTQQIETEHQQLQQQHQQLQQTSNSAMVEWRHVQQQQRTDTDHQLRSLQEQHQLHLLNCQRAEDAKIAALKASFEDERKHVLAQHNADRTALQQQLEQIVSLKSQAETGKLKAEGYVHELKAKLTRATEQLAQTQKDKKRLEEELQQAQTQIVDFKSLSEALQSQLTTMQSHEATQTRQLEQQRQDIAALKAQGQGQRTQLQQLQQHSAALERTLSSSVNEIHKGNGVITSLHEQLTAAQHALDQQQQHNHKLEAEQQQLRSNLERTQEELERQRQAQDKSSQQAQEAEQALKAARARVEELEIQVTNKESVITWMNKQMGGGDFASQHRAVFMPSTNPSLRTHVPAGQGWTSGAAKLAEVLQHTKQGSKGLHVLDVNKPQTSSQKAIDPKLLEDDAPRKPKSVEFSVSKTSPNGNQTRSRLPKPSSHKPLTTPPQKGPPSTMATPADHHRKLRTTNGAAAQEKPRFNVYSDYTNVLN